MDKPNPEPRTLVLNPNDNVAVALSVIQPGVVTSEGVTARERVPKGHKIATGKIETGAPVRQVRPDHRLCHKRHRCLATGCMSTIPAWAR